MLLKLGKDWRNADISGAVDTCLDTAVQTCAHFAEDGMAAALSERGKTRSRQALTGSHHA